jgi:hypothetical protein
MGHHHRDDEIAELLLQFGQQALGVPCNDILRLAVERVARNVARVAGARRRRVSGGVDGEVAAGDRLEVLLVEVGELLTPILLEVGDGLDHQFVHHSGGVTVDFDVAGVRRRPVVLTDAGDLWLRPATGRQEKNDSQN